VRASRHPWCNLEKPPLDPPVADLAPTDPILTGYDEQHLITYLRLLDAESDGADWREVARVVLKIDPNSQPQRARRAWESHLSRAKWMTTNGFEHLLRGGAPH
jgi:T6SS, Transcription factor, DNA binding domain